MSAPFQLGEKVLQGIPVSAGVCRGRLVVLGRPSTKVPCHPITDEQVPENIAQLEQALVKTRHQIMDVQRQVSHNMGGDDALIFDAHLLMLEDPMLMAEVIRYIEEKKVNVAWAWQQSADKYVTALSAIEDEYLRERVSDLRDVATRVINNLLDHQGGNWQADLTEPCIVVSHDLSPSTTAVLDKNKVLGFATDIGSKTSHTAIMARSLQIPAVVGLKTASADLVTGQYALLDGYDGLLIINPTDQALHRYGQIVSKHADLQEKMRDVRDKPAVTLDGVRIILSANVERAEEVDAVIACGAEGVGLFRTEFLYMNQGQLPTEEEQYQVYSKIAMALRPQPVVIRTLDLGGDKFASNIDSMDMNSFFGWRAIRFCLREKEIFRTQLRAILRASAAGNIKLMYPMISGVEEMMQANALVELYKAELHKENLPFDENLEIGCMIEIPAAVLSADCLARRSKFFSIGTNDLIQYTLAVDRLNEKVSYLYEPTNPAILRLIKMTTEAAHRHGLWAGVCGEMASEPVMIPLLLGLGVDELSVAPSGVLPAKYMLRRLNKSECVELVNTAFDCETGAEVLHLAQKFAREMVPCLFEQLRPSLA